MVLTHFSAPGSRARRWRWFREKFVEFILFSAAASSVLVTAGIVWTLISESIPFFKNVSLWDFITGTEWTPTFENAKFGILPLLGGTFLSTFIGLIVAIPLGTIAAAYLSEYMKPQVREIVKPILELLAAVPTVVYGYFALLFVTPLLQQLFPQIQGFNILAAGLVIGFMIIPYVSSLSEDAMRAVPNHFREASLALGASQFQTTIRVVIPGAFSGISSAYVLAISRALGETMVVAIAGGNQPQLTMDPTQPAATITAFIVQISQGDLPHGSIGYQSIYVAGLTLFVITFSFNVLGLWIRKRIQEKE
ncbi:MAG: phosphate ABC transporter permease subunit PstC [Bdellovibrionota bacterium]